MKPSAKLLNIFADERSVSFGVKGKLHMDDRTFSNLLATRVNFIRMDDMSQRGVVPTD